MWKKERERRREGRIEKRGEIDDKVAEYKKFNCSVYIYIRSYIYIISREGPEKQSEKPGGDG